MARLRQKVRGAREVACGAERLVFRDLIALTPLVHPGYDRIPCQIRPPQQEVRQAALLGDVRLR
jgi:hypothetical protein